MKTAEEVAEELSICPCEHQDCAQQCAYEKELAQALTAYAEERVKEAVDISTKNACIVRAEAFEEAAKMAENTWDYIPQETWNEGFEPDYELTQKTAAERIRALKTKP